MTKREFYAQVAAGAMNDEMMAYAAEALVKMDETLEKRKGKVSEKVQAQRDANAAMAAHVAHDILGTEAMTATDVAAALTAELGEEVKVQRASYLCRKAVELGLATATEVKIPKKGVQKAYTVIAD